MKKIISFTCFIISMVIIAQAGTVSNSELINKIKVSDRELPEGFIFGKVPGFAKKVLKENPWILDKGAIKKMAGRIYPDGDFNNISDIHMTIMSKKGNPFKDDMVCYVIFYKNNSAAQKELKKITSYAEYNRDRVILMVKKTIAVYLLADDVDNFAYLKTIAGNLKSRLDEI